MAVTNRLTIVNGILAQYAMAPVATLDENATAITIDGQLDRLLYLYQEVSVDWSFLIKTATLDAQETDSVSTEWRYTYQFPADYLRIKKVFHNPNGEFEIRGQAILTNAPKVTFDYIGFNGSYDVFPPHFIEGFIFYCSIKLCMGITRQEELLKGLAQQYEEMVLPMIEATEMRLRAGYRTKLNRYPLTGLRRIVM